MCMALALCMACACSIDARAEEGEKKQTGNGHLIAIDAGHQSRGNSEKEPVGPGASEMKMKVSGGTKGVSTGIYEYVLTLEVSLKLKEELESRGYEVYMVRETHDVDISNSERAQMAYDSGAEVFVRIHANGSENKKANGAMTICPTEKNPYVASLYGESRHSLSRSGAGRTDCQRGVQKGKSMGNGYYERHQLEQDTGDDCGNGLYDKPGRGSENGGRGLPAADCCGNRQRDRRVF